MQQALQWGGQQPQRNARGNAPFEWRRDEQGDFPMGEVERGQERRNKLSNILTTFSGNPSDPWCSVPAMSSLSSTQTQLTLPGTDHQQRTGYYPWDTPRPATDMALTKSMELVKHIWREGIMVNATHDEELSLDAQSIIKDLIFQLSQKWNEVTHLQRRTEDLQRESLLHKWEDVGELELRPPKWRERQLEEVVPSHWLNSE